MYKNLDVFRMAHAMASHAGSRQAVIARNMANADTPGYVAQDIAPFEAVLESDFSHGGLRATRESHLNWTASSSDAQTFDRPASQADPNGNTVSVETEMLHAVNVKRQHDRAITIYKSALGVLRSAVGRR